MSVLSQHYISFCDTGEQNEGWLFQDYFSCFEQLSKIIWNWLLLQTFKQPSGSVQVVRFVNACVLIMSAINEKYTLNDIHLSATISVKETFFWNPGFNRSFHFRWQAMWMWKNGHNFITILIYSKNKLSKKIESPSASSDLWQWIHVDTF